MKSKSHNLDFIKESFNNDEEEILEIIDMFMEMVPSSILQMKDSLAKQKQEELRKTAHKLKTSFMLFQSDRALEITKGFELGKYDLLESHTSIFELEKIVNEIVESLKLKKKNLLSTQH